VGVSVGGIVAAGAGVKVNVNVGVAVGVAVGETTVIATYKVMLIYAPRGLRNRQ
jgi:hypothetical protein